ncbi:M23 family metallopeptidase [Actinacidiphila acidipaludis]|uniref:M23 family metallopeptidase n=1 Tax=Actinacidiphila acidipaludis TaxID=2873382 RepID=UPI0027E008E3|nr:M23 family metallopeptidase [Streptomyces acidipaludis]
MNEGPSSGYSPDYDAYGYDPYSTGSHQTVGTAFGDDTTGTYAIPQQYTPSHDQTQGYGYSFGYDASATQSWDTGGYATHDPYAYGQAQGQAATVTGTGSYGAGSYGTGSYDTSAYETGSYDTGSYETGAFTSFPQAHPTPQQDWDSGAYPTYGYGYGYGYDASGDTGVYEHLAPTATPAAAPAYDTAYGTAYGTGYPAADDRTTAFPAPGAHAAQAASPADAPDPYADDLTADPYAGDAPSGADDRYLADPADPADLADELAYSYGRDEPTARHDYANDEYSADGFADGEPTARSRRRKPAKRSALLTVAVPSVAVMGVAAVGAAAVAGVGMAQSSSTTQADATAKTPTQQLDRQLTGVSRDADDFATRASRSQERLDLKERQAAAKKAAAEAAARKEALRPKFVLPVTQKGLSAYFGQAGVNWMALHTGIDFPVQVGTPVMAVTDGTVRTQWNPSYGNMAIVTAPDGTETWYCHLSSTKIRSGSVKAGTVIAYSGNTGNTTGPHLHLEVRPHGGSPIDPLPWLLAHGLDPR